MRNLVSLQRRVWALETSSAPTDCCVAFTSVTDDSQVFFLRASGRIESLQLEEEDAESASKELELFVDVRDGSIVSVDVDAVDGEEVGSVDSGLRAVAWSDNQEMLALVTGAGSLLVMSNDWEVLHETQVQDFLPSELKLADCGRDSEHWCCQLRWREDSKFVALNVATEVKESGNVEHKVLVFTEQIEFHALGRLEDGRPIPGLGSALDWSQSLALIASSEVRKTRLVVVFFERNGLRHGEFVIPAAYRAPEFRVGSVRWNATSDTLAVSLHRTASNGESEDNKQRTVVQLWSRNNYHWYLKQEMQLPEDDQLVDFAWDEEAAGRLNLLTCSLSTQELTLDEHEFTWDICGVEAERPQQQLTQSSRTQEAQRQSIAVTGVIDGSKLLLTPLHCAMVPPPFALLQASFDAAINSVAFDSQNEVLLVLLANGTVVLVENYLNPADARTSAAGLPPPPNVDSLYSEALGLYDLDLVRTVAIHSQRDPTEYVPFLDRVAHLENENWRKYTIDVHLERHARALTHLAALIDDIGSGNDEEKSKLQTTALELIERGKLYDQALQLFPLAAVKRSSSQSDGAFRQQILRLKGDFLEADKKYEAAAYVYLSASDKEKARRAFIAANKWQMALALSARDQQTPDKLRSEAYTIAQELLNKQQQQQVGSVQDILAVARIYIEYCNDVDEAVALLVTHQQWAEALRVAYLHKRDDLVESDIETGVLQCCDDVQEELARKEKQYTKHWKRLTTICEQKRLFKLYGIDGSRWNQGGGVMVTPMG
ncbi:Elongator complex protein 1 [Phytophthora cinnamomi]|uniref:Elongator complex protein 1 n=1 Tax=Phytophthora cinnamomi TaxID=4785 RepID=UPI00355975C2|nr:Elongator complex protein 1 [Phytophthora cinnamomi]